MQLLESLNAGFAGFMSWQRQSLGQGFGASEVHLGPLRLVLLSVLGMAVPLLVVAPIAVFCVCSLFCCAF